jgi:hypothetical protein
VFEAAITMRKPWKYLWKMRKTMEGDQWDEEVKLRANSGGTPDMTEWGPSTTNPSLVAKSSSEVP